MTRDRQLALPLTAPAADAPDPLSTTRRPSRRPAPPPPPRRRSARAPDADGEAIRFVRRRGTRRYILRVQADGSLRVTVPWWGSRREAVAFVTAQAAWIALQRARLAARPDRQWRVGREVLLDGRPAVLAVGADDRVICGGEPVGTAAASADLRPIVARWLRSRAARDLPGQLAALAAVHGIEVRRVTVRDQSSRWGSCSRRGAISLNWRLIQVPPFVREYVLVHELMHRRELNHSARFWRHVAAACPRYVEARRWLRVEGARLFD